MKKKILGIFDRRPLIWFHYVLLLGVLYGGWYLGDFILGESFIKLPIMLAWFYIFISIGDQLIHKILGVD